jgi:hypothetical protein
MKVQIIISTIFIVILTCCDHPTVRETEKKDTPKALEDKSSSLEMVSKRGDGDIVATLYAGLVDKTPELKQLEDRIADISESEADSTKSFDNFDSKNLSYYNTVDRYIEQIRDSLLRDKVKALVASSLASYNLSISPNKDLLKSIEAKKLALGDLHTILKITRTLPVIEKFQKENLPSPAPLKGYLKQLNGTIQYADSISEK